MIHLFWFAYFNSFLVIILCWVSFLLSFFLTYYSNERVSDAKLQQLFIVFRYVFNFLFAIHCSLTSVLRTWLLLSNCVETSSQRRRTFRMPRKSTSGLWMLRPRTVICTEICSPTIHTFLRFLEIPPLLSFTRRNVSSLTLPGPRFAFVP